MKNETYYEHQAGVMLEKARRFTHEEKISKARTCYKIANAYIELVKLERSKK